MTRNQENAMSAIVTQYTVGARCKSRPDVNHSDDPLVPRPANRLSGTGVA